MKRVLRVAGTVLAGAGVLAAAWAFTVWRWQDPFTALYTSQQQSRLTGEYTHASAQFRPERRLNAETPLWIEKRDVLRAARRYRAGLDSGDAVGRLRVPRLGLNAIVVEGTDSDSLTKGPGRYSRSYLPGEGQLIYVAGHRTTYGAPFAHIDRLQHGDTFSFELPYATFLYRVARHVIVPSDDVARLRSAGREEVALQACHPRFFATHRYIVYARPIKVSPRGGRTYTLIRDTA